MAVLISYLYLENLLSGGRGVIINWHRCWGCEFLEPPQMVFFFVGQWFETIWRMGHLRQRVPIVMNEFEEGRCRYRDFSLAPRWAPLVADDGPFGFFSVRLFRIIK